MNVLQEKKMIPFYFGTHQLIDLIKAAHVVFFTFLSQNNEVLYAWHEVVISHQIK